MDRLIIGLGTGRCGTVSLTKLLSKQKDTYASHEHIGARVAWGCDFTEVVKSISQQNRFIRKFNADVSFYNLPYVKDFLEHYHDVKFIILKRNRDEVIQSFDHKTAGKNHWQKHSGAYYTKCEWDKCFPNFEAVSKKDAIGKWWDFYYDECESISQDICYHLNTEDLNNKNKCLDMLRFCGYDEPIYEQLCLNSNS